MHDLAINVIPMLNPTTASTVRRSITLKVDHEINVRVIETAEFELPDAVPAV